MCGIVHARGQKPQVAKVRRSHRPPHEMAIANISGAATRYSDQLAYGPVSDKAERCGILLHLTTGGTRADWVARTGLAVMNQRLLSPQSGLCPASSHVTHVIRRWSRGRSQWAVAPPGVAVGGVAPFSTRIGEPDGRLQPQLFMRLGHLANSTF